MLLTPLFCKNFAISGTFEGTRVLALRVTREIIKLTSSVLGSTQRSAKRNGAPRLFTEFLLKFGADILSLHALRRNTSFRVFKFALL
jgi:hypothetical protein